MENRFTQIDADYVKFHGMPPGPELYTSKSRRRTIPLTALRRLAQMTGFVISFHPSEPRSTTPLWPPFLNEKGRQIFPSSAFRRILQMFPGLAFSGIAVARNRRQRRAMRQASNERAATMCVILHKPAS
jgi:hypothetical protein